MTKRQPRQRPGQVRTFDHERFASVPEYRALADAINTFANTDHELTWPQTFELLTTMARAAPYGDICHSCSARGDYGRPACFPYRVDVNQAGTGLTAHYACPHPECGDRWTCGWSSNIDIMGF